MKDLNLIVAVDDTVAFSEEAYTDLMSELEPKIVFTLYSQEGDEGLVIKNAPDDYLVWFVGSTYKTVGEDSQIDKFHITGVSAHYAPHAALNHMCLQMKIDTEGLEDRALEERHNQVIPGDE